MGGFAFKYRLVMQLHRIHMRAAVPSLSTTARLDPSLSTLRVPLSSGFVCPFCRCREAPSYPLKRAPKSMYIAA
jgi:hypothetical protein